ncbi:hypothetical protein PAXRUDRAFT_679688 [Paxillus rubicundulus Ve08.2h10]|uniref:Uncharacterized protein n=1 Tax=Paxillus rubicundulus Ve08.2h10 TaxID=930991 RepID=A0A0D0EBZ6_9AGAM|nr:hypothetical protein PAXRUDRAFT_679688 [Paxillus rubicundulus Ve08.2h10]
MSSVHLRPRNDCITRIVPSWLRFFSSSLSPPSPSSLSLLPPGYERCYRRKTISAVRHSFRFQAPLYRHLHTHRLVFKDQRANGPGVPLPETNHPCAHVHEAGCSPHGSTSCQVEPEHNRIFGVNIA